MSWTGVLILVGMMLLLLYGLWISMKDSFPDSRKTHHDNRPGSHYQVSQQALRDARNDYENRRGGK